MIKVKFFIKNPKEGSNSIYVRVRAGRKLDLVSTTKEVSSLSDWNSEEGYLLESFKELRNGKVIATRGADIKNRILENTKVNYRLAELKKEIEDTYKVSELFDTQTLKGLIFPVATETEDLSKQSFVDYFETFINSKGSSISEDYVTKVNSIKAIIERYIRFKKLKDLLLIDIDTDFKNDFEKYCLNVEKYSANYFERNFKFIKTILYHAQSNGYPIYHGLSRIKCMTEKTMFVILTPQELELIEKSKFSDEHLEVAKDWLLISCYSGQRISDFMRFNTSMIIKKYILDKEKYFIEFIQEKTKKQMLLPLHEKIIKILEKRDWDFPRKMSEPRYNEHIKKVCEYVGIDEEVEGSLSIEENKDSKQKIQTLKSKNKRRKVKGIYPKYKLISSHTGRRSFASNNFGTIPTPLLMRATGHSSEAMLLKYIGKIEEQQSLALAEYL